MKFNKEDLDKIIDKAAFHIRDEQIDDSVIERSAERVWAMMAQHGADRSLHLEGVDTVNSNNTEHIHGCDDFQSLMPAYLDGTLSKARKLLLEDHSNECIPCRQELKAQRNLAAAKSATYIAPAHTARNARKPLRTGKSRWTTAATDTSAKA